MLLNTKIRYGVRALFDISFHGGGKATKIADICRRQRISRGYLEQIFQDLKKAGLVKAKRGSHGGYLLAKPPEMVTVGDIILLTQKEFNLVDCSESSGRHFKKGCERQGKCVTQNFWVGATWTLLDYLADITIKDLCQKAKEMGVESEAFLKLVYHI